MLPFKKILCPIDFSELSYGALGAANELAANFSAELMVVHVVSTVPIVPGIPAVPVTFNVPEYQQEMEASAKKLAEEVIQHRVSKGIRVRTVVIPGDAAQRIVQIAEEESVDLIVMSTHGQTGWQHLVFGSVAEKVVRLAPCPVLILREPGKAG